MGDPQTLDQMLSDDDALGAFLAWQPGLTAVAMFCREAAVGYIDDGTPIAQVIGQFGPDGQYPIDWDALGMEHMFDGAMVYGAAGAEDDPDLMGGSHAGPIARRTVREIDQIFRTEVLESYFESFRSSAGVSAPTEQVIDLTAVDWGTVDTWNAALLKNLSPGENIAFWQYGAYLIIGADQSLAWRKAIEAANGYDPATGEDQSGWITMEARGGMVSSGKVSVTGNYDRGPFKEAIRRVSNKDISFN